MSDITALVLSMGEDSTTRAIASVRRQTPAVAEVIVVRNLSPFHRAFNSGVAQVRTPFFVQVDADMILDETCVADLRSAVAEGVGIVVGHLRDPLLDRIVGIKLFRTECCVRARLPDSVSAETDFVATLWQQGWTTVYALNYTNGPPASWHIFGKHEPDYTPFYTFAKYVREGAKARYRKVGKALRYQSQQLSRSTHEVAYLAMIGLAHGIFVEPQRDIHAPDVWRADFASLARFLSSSPTDGGIAVRQENLIQADLEKGFLDAYALGIQLRRHQAAATFMACLRQLQQESEVPAWVALVGLCQGIFVDEDCQAEALRAFAMLGELFPM
jgi:hypothetical protein